MDYIELLKAIGITSVPILSLFLIVVFFGRKIAERWFEAGAERYKAELQLQQNRFSIQFSKLHQDRAEVIKEMHGKLVRLNEAVTVYVSPIGDKTGYPTIKEIWKSVNAFGSYVTENSIYFEKEFYQKLSKIHSAYRDGLVVYRIAERGQERPTSSHNSIERFRNKMIAIGESITKDLPPLIEELQEEFRNLLGVESK